jgi:uncharacterized membrane protein YphA (DoxX/SURF4 family)
MNAETQKPITPRGARAGAWAEFAAAALRFAERRAGPVLDLFIRLWLAQTFFVSGVLKAANWDTALLLAEHEYPVSWMDSVTAAYLGAAIELVCPVLLALGLATRFAAIPMLILALVIQLNYQALDAHLFWAALFGWYVVRGAGPLSLDRSLRKGLADSALPLAASILRSLAWVTTRMGPVYQLGLRLWLAAGIAAAFTFTPGSLWLPTASGAAFPAILAAACAVLLALGLASGVAALALMAALAAVEMSGPGADDTPLADDVGIAVALRSGLVIAGPDGRPEVARPLSPA